MDCPACGKKLAKKKVAEIELDVCDQGCNGVWFDNHELKKFDEPHEPSPDAQLNLKSAPIKAAAGKQRHCPKCKSIIMLRRFASVKRKVEIDECGKCAGIWLDAGELAAIRDEFKTEGDRSKAFDQFFDDMFSGQLDAERAKSRAQADSTRRIANAVKFICPSYYLPGKQKGGAF